MPHLKYNGQFITSEGQFLGKTPIIFDDWFLPSWDELEQIKLNLYDFAVGGFGSQYWSSTEASASSASCITMSSGGTVNYGKASTVPLTRAVRSFTAPISAYNLRDAGPAGGFIFYIDGTTYYESAPLDTQVASSIWSNISSTEIGTTAAEIGEGQNNTNDIIGQGGFTTGAAKLCDELEVISYQ